MLTQKQIEAAYIKKMELGLSDNEASDVIRNLTEFASFNEKQDAFMEYLFTILF